mgnify:CR=1 FL=1
MINAFWTALYGRLAGGTALTSLIGGTATPRIYHNQAPDGATLPYVVYNWQGGGYQHTTPSVDVDGVLTVQAYSRVGQVQAGTISSAVFDLLDRLPLTVTGWANIGFFAESPHLQANYTDPSGLTTYSCGEMYRVYLDRS